MWMRTSRVASSCVCGSHTPGNASRSWGWTSRPGRSRWIRATQVVSVRGEIDIFTAPEFKERVNGAIDAGRDHVIVDLSGTTFIDSSSLGVLISAHRRLANRDGRLIIACDVAAVLNTFKITGLDAVLHVVPTAKRRSPRATHRRRRPAKPRPDHLLFAPDDWLTTSTVGVLPAGRGRLVRCTIGWNSTSSPAAPAQRPGWQHRAPAPRTLAGVALPARPVLTRPGPAGAAASRTRHRRRYRRGEEPSTTSSRSRCSGC